MAENILTPHCTTDLTEREVKDLAQKRQILLNCFYLDNLIPGNTLKDIQKYGGVTHWEALHYVGYNTLKAQLEAVVYIKQPLGYSDGFRNTGSAEYIRFFIDWGDGEGFQDIGLTRFIARNNQPYPRAFHSPEQHRAQSNSRHKYPAADGELHYLQPQSEVNTRHQRRIGDSQMQPSQYKATLAVSKSIRRRFWIRKSKVKIRAVLAWNQIPNTDPEFAPLYGNSLDGNFPTLALRSLARLTNSRESFF